MKSHTRFRGLSKLKNLVGRKIFSRYFLYLEMLICIKEYFKSNFIPFVLKHPQNNVNDWVDRLKTGPDLGSNFSD